MVRINYISVAIVVNADMTHAEPSTALPTACALHVVLPQGCTDITADTNSGGGKRSQIKVKRTATADVRQCASKLSPTGKRSNNVVTGPLYRVGCQVLPDWVCERRLPAGTPTVRAFHEHASGDVGHQSSLTTLPLVVLHEPELGGNTSIKVCATSVPVTKPIGSPTDTSPNANSHLQIKDIGSDWGIRVV